MCGAALPYSNNRWLWPCANAIPNYCTRAPSYCKCAFDGYRLCVPVADRCFIERKLPCILRLGYMGFWYKWKKSRRWLADSTVWIIAANVAVTYHQTYIFFSHRATDFIFFLFLFFLCLVFLMRVRTRYGKSNCWIA